MATGVRGKAPLWVRVDYLGAQPMILRGQVSRQRYAFNPGQGGAVDERDVEWLTEMNNGRLFRVKET